MLRLSDYLKQDVLDADGIRVGRLDDLTVGLSERFPRVTRLLVDGRFIEWDMVSSFERTQIALVKPESELERGEQVHDELLLTQGVLDCQIVDIEGKRVARVGDVELAREGDELRCVAVDTGLAPVARRLKLRWLAKHLSEGTVSWENIHLSSNPGHTLQLNSPAAAVHSLTPKELMHLVGRLSVRHGVEVLQAVPVSAGAEALSAGRPEVAAALLQALPRHRAGEILAQMPVDDAASTLRALERTDTKQLLSTLDEKTASVIRELLAHQDDTAGAMMTPDAQTAHINESITEIRERIATSPPTLDGLLTVVLIDEHRRPHGVLPVSTILRGSGEPVPVPAVSSDTPLDAVMELFATYDVLAIPVIDSNGALLGVVAVDDILDKLLAHHRPGKKRYSVMNARRHAPT